LKDNVIYYSVGALLYCPANKSTIASAVINGKFGNMYSLALCLEDTINDNFVMEAEHILTGSVMQIYREYQQKSFYLPKIFIRVRNPEQVIRLTKSFGDAIKLITGFIIPKFNPLNARQYINAVIKANEISAQKKYIMPIYEHSSIINLKNRAEILYSLKDTLSNIEELVLNIRVGGNDLCHMFGFRRHADESIHSIKPIADIFSDIITVYGTDYVISGPVWEYYNGNNWKNGLTSEIKEDKLCGFIGKTVIHPCQVPVLNQLYQVTEPDFSDAVDILNWNQSSSQYVSGNIARERMNEYKTHYNWAKQTLFLAEVFGVKNN